MVKLLEDVVTISNLGTDKIEVKLTKSECEELYGLLGDYLGKHYIHIPTTYPFGYRDFGVGVTTQTNPTAVDHRSPENRVNINKL